jgi:hypothetical protein
MTKPPLTTETARIKSIGLGDVILHRSIPRRVLEVDWKSVYVALRLEGFGIELYGMAETVTRFVRAKPRRVYPPPPPRKSQRQNVSWTVNRVS